MPAIYSTLSSQAWGSLAWSNSALYVDLCAKRMIEKCVWVLGQKKSEIGKEYLYSRLQISVIIKSLDSFEFQSVCLL